MPIRKDLFSVALTVLLCLGQTAHSLRGLICTAVSEATHQPTALPDAKTWAAWVFASGIMALAVFVAVHLSHQGTPSQLVALGVLVLLGGMALALCLRSPSLDTLPLSAVLCTAVLLGCAALFAKPLLEDDHFRYLWDGFMGASTGQPYRHAPDHFFGDGAVPLVMQNVLSGINNPELPTIYGPVLQGLFSISYFVAPAELWPFKLALLLAESTVLVALHKAGVKPRWLLLLALHPLVLKESAITGHPDLLLGAALLLATLAWLRGREAMAAVCVCLAVAMKMSALVALPFFLLNHRGGTSARAVVAAVLTLAVCYAPFVLLSGGGELRALVALGGQWTFNPLLFRLVAWVLPEQVARAGVAAAFVVVWSVISWRWWRALCARAAAGSTGAPVAPPVVAVVVALLLLSPALNPWYWLWILPLATWRFSPLAWVCASASLLAYAHMAEQVWKGSAIVTFAVPLWATLVQCVAVGLGASWAVDRRREAAQTNGGATPVVDAEAQPDRTGSAHRAVGKNLEHAGPP